VNSVAVQADGKVLVGGFFTSYNGTTGQNRLLRPNADGSRDASFATGSGFDDFVLSLAVQADGKVLAGGYFTSYNGVSGSGFIRLNADGTRDASLAIGTGFDATVNSIAVQPNGQVLAGGDFTSYNGTTQNSLTRLNADGSRDASFATGTGFDSFVRSVVLQADGQALVGGDFTSYNGTSGQAGLLRLGPDGSRNATATALSGATFSFSPGGSTTNPLVASTAGSYSVVASLNGETSAASNTVVLTPCPPALTALSTAAELPGMPVVLTGTNFTSGSTVSFGGVAAGSVTYTSPTSLTAVVPVGAAPGSSAVVVHTASGDSPGSPAFEVLQVYRSTAASGCLSTDAVSLTGSGGPGNWRYLRLAGAGGAVVAAIEDTYNLGTVSVGFQALGTATGTAVRRDGGSRAYLDRNFYLTATNQTFPGQTVRVRFFGLSSELARLQAVDGNANLAGLKASQYSGPNENCDLSDNTTADRRTLAAPATVVAGADWFTAQLTVADHFSEFYLTGASTPLPVELVAFTAVAKGTNVQLNWRTASEKNSARFEVERSLDGQEFTKIGELAGQDSKASPTDYSYLDPLSLLPAYPPTRYYRLRQVDLDGTASYSPVRAVTFPHSSIPSFTFYPNPAHAAVTVAGIAAGTQVEVFDAVGRVVAQATADASGTAQLALPGGLPAGVYVVRSGASALRLAVE
jgi:uncharacterized delta-60 repeat protein